MSAPLTLHYAPDNASLCVRLALEELGLPYRTTLVDRAAGGQKSAAFLALNPNGLIPVIETPQGPVFETAAILIWLADTTGAMLPAPDDPGRAHALQWLVWLANTLHATERMLFYPDQYMADGHDLLRAGAQRRVLAHLDLLNAARNALWLDADDPTMLACYLGPLLRWPALYGGPTGWYDLARWPRLLAFARRFEDRPAAKRTAAREGLGDHPFSVPVPCHPPEGSAT